MRTRRHKLQVSTFPFLAVLLCAMGALLLVLLVMDRRAHDAARYRAAQVARRVAEEAAQEAEARRSVIEGQRQEARAARQCERETAHARLAVQEADVQKQIDAVREELARAAERLRAEQDAESVLKRKAEVEQARAGQEEQALVRVRAEESATAAAAKEQAEASRKAREEMTAQLASLEQTLESLKAARKKEDVTYSVVPYNGKHGESRRPVYVECAAGKVIFYPDPTPMAEPFSPTAVGAEVERRLEKQKEPSSSAKVGAYLMLLVRPDGVSTYYRFRDALRGGKVDFGYEFIDKDWVLDFSADDQDSPSQTWMAAKPADAGPAGPAGASGPHLHGVAAGDPQGVALGSRPADGPPDLPGPPGAPGLSPPSGTGNAGGTGVGSGTGPSRADAAPSHGSAFGQGAQGSSRSPDREGATPGLPPRGSAGPSGPGGPFVGPRGTSMGGSPAGPPVAGASERLIPEGSATGSGPGPGGATSPAAHGGPAVIAASPTAKAGLTQSQSTGPGGGTGASTGSGSSAGGHTGADGASAAPAAPTGGAAATDKADRPAAIAGPPGAAAGSPSASTPADSAKKGLAGATRPASAGAAGNSPDDDPFLRAPPSPVLPNKKHAPVPLRPARLGGDRDWIIYVECKPEGVVVYPTQTLVPMTALSRPSGSNPLLQTVQQLIDHKQATVRPGETPYRPEVRFLVRPDALRTYHLAYPTLDTLAAPKTAQDLGPDDDVSAVVAGH